MVGLQITNQEENMSYQQRSFNQILQQEAADSEDTCIYQGNRPQPVCAFTHAVLLTNFDSSTQESLELTLSRCRYRIVRPEAEGIFCDDLTNDELQQVDFLILRIAVTRPGAGFAAYAACENWMACL